MSQQLRFPTHGYLPRLSADRGDPGCRWGLQRNPGFPWVRDRADRGYSSQAEKCLANLDASLTRPPKIDDLVERGDLDAEAADRVVAPLQAAFDGASAYAAAHPEELKAKEPGAVIAWTLVEPQAALFLRELKDLRRDLADTVLSEEKQVRRVNRDLHNVNVDFNNVISAYNGTVR